MIGFIIGFIFGWETKGMYSQKKENNLFISDGIKRRDYDKCLKCSHIHHDECASWETVECDLEKRTYTIWNVFSDKEELKDFESNECLCKPIKEEK